MSNNFIIIVNYLLHYNLFNMYRIRISKYLLFSGFYLESIYHYSYGTIKHITALYSYILIKTQRNVQSSPNICNFMKIGQGNK